MTPKPTPADVRRIVQEEGSIAAAARVLGLSRTTVRARLREAEAAAAEVAIPVENMPENIPAQPPFHVEAPWKPAVVYRQLPQREPWWTHIPVWIWQVLAGAALVAWAYHGR